MNIWGKVLAFLIILSGGGAMVLSTQLLDFRNSWVKQVDANQKTLVQQKAVTLEKRRELEKLRADYERLMLAEGSIFDNVQATVTAPDTLQVQIGPPQILEIKDKDGKPVADKDGKPVQPMIYAFRLDATGKYVYVGEFRAEQIANGNSTFKATMALPDDAAMMQASASWRIRTRIPVSDKLNFLDFARKFHLLEEHATAKTAELQTLTTEVAPRVAKNLTLRENLARGFEDYKADRKRLPDVLVDGQLPTLALMEEARNGILAQADLLRHKLHKAVTEFERLQTENAQAAGQLPKAKTGESPTVSKR